MNSYSIGIISFILFMIILICYTNLKKKVPIFRVILVFSFIPYILTLFLYYFMSYNLSFWSYTLLYCFLNILSYFVFYALVKSVSVRILIDLLSTSNFLLTYNAILDDYILKDSFSRRIDLLIENGMISMSSNNLILTKKGKNFIFIIIVIQKLFQIKFSG